MQDSSASLPQDLLTLIDDRGAQPKLSLPNAVAYAEMKHETRHMNEHMHTQSPLLGWWRLLSCEIEIRESGLREPMYATPAFGYIYFGAEGRMITVIEATGRERPTDRNGFADAFLGSAAYTGRYRLEGGRWTTHVDAGWNPWWSDTDQERIFRIESDQLQVESEWFQSPKHANQWVRAHLSWTRGEYTQDSPALQAATR